MHRVKQAYLWTFVLIAMLSLTVSKGMAVHHLSATAGTAASRPKTPGQQVCPAILLPTFKQAPFPIGMWHLICWCQTHLLSLERHASAVTPPVGLFHSALPLFLRPSETQCLDRCPGLRMRVARRACYSMVTGTGAKNLYRSLLHIVQGFHHHPRSHPFGEFISFTRRPYKWNPPFFPVLAPPKTHRTFYLVLATGRCVPLPSNSRIGGREGQTDVLYPRSVPRHCQQRLLYTEIADSEQRHHWHGLGPQEPAPLAGIEETLKLKLVICPLPHKDPRQSISIDLFVSFKTLDI